MRQIAGAFAEYEKARLVHKLRHARERQRKESGKCEGRKAHSELHPDVVAEAKRLRGASPKTGERLSFRKISARLAEAGFLSENADLSRCPAVGDSTVAGEGSSWLGSSRLSPLLS